MSFPRHFLTGLLLAAGLAHSPLLAETYVVDQAKGKDSNSGSANSPVQTLGAAVEKLEPGDTILIRDGVYREHVSVKVLGTESKPLVIKADAGAKPVLSGADVVTGWTALGSAAEAAGNPAYAKIYTVEIPWKPTALFENGQEQKVSQMPDGGWWPAPQTEETSLTDAERLTNSDIVADGASIYFFKYKGFAFSRQKIASFDRATGTIQVAKSLGRGAYTPGSDRYRLENHVRYVDQPGEWAYAGEDDATSFKLYYMPRGDISKALVEVPRRERILDLGSSAYCTVEGLEITMAANPGRTPDAAILNEANKHVGGAGENITIRKCKIHHNGRFGIQGTGHRNLVVENNLIYRNGYGVALSGQAGTRIEGNEIAENSVDGLIISHGCTDITVKNNYIHHHCLYGHPDNVQFYRDVKNIRIEGNFVLAAGQSFMMEQVEGVTFTNNIVAGADANMMIMGHGNANGGTWERNTLALWTSSLFSLTGKDYRMKGNMFVNTGGKLVYGIPAEGEFESTENLWHQIDGVKFARLAGWKQSDGTSKWYNGLESLQADGQERGSVMQDPGFKNIPAFLTTLNPHKIGDCTTDKIYYDESGCPEIKTGDYVEVHFDGVPRKVVSSEGGALVIDPPLADVPDRTLFVANWRDKKDFQLDFSNPNSGKYGSTIDTLAFRRGDFNGDGKRDIPEY
jgi:parallel beta-helix repeat protein